MTIKRSEKGRRELVLSAVIYDSEKPQQDKWFTDRIIIFENFFFPFAPIIFIQTEFKEFSKTQYFFFSDELNFFSSTIFFYAPYQFKLALNFYFSIYFINY